MFTSLFISCQVEEDLEVQKPKSEQFKTQIQNYLNALSSREVESSFFNSTSLKATINYESTQSVVLNDAQTLLITDLGNVTKNDKATATKMVFFLHKDGIKKANIISFENTIPFSDYNKTIKYMLNNQDAAIIYSGKLTIYSDQGRFEFSGELENGQLKTNSRAFRSKKLNPVAKTNQHCTSWYRVVRLGEEVISVTFLYQICDGSVSEGGSGSSADSGGTGDWAVFPLSPLDKALFTHFAPDGVMTVYRYNAARNFWSIISTSLPAVAVSSYPKHQQNLQNVYWPFHNQRVVADDAIYTYNTYTDVWLVEPIEIVLYDCAGLKKQITAISKDEKFISAVSDITAASVDGFEHSITLGIGSDGKINQAPMNNGTSQYKVPVNKTWAGAFAAIHNHPDGTPMSSGDVYAAVALNTSKPNFTTTYLLLPDGSMYALVVTDLVAATAFVNTYPAEVIGNNSPEFPDAIFNPIDDLKRYMGESVEGRTRALAFVLDQNNAGIKLLKQDTNGDFNPIQTEETITGTIKTYTPKPCN